MGVSQQQVSKILKGQKNFTLQTIATLESILETRLIETPSGASVKARVQKASTKKAAAGLAEPTSSKANKGQEPAGKTVKKYRAPRGVSKVAEPGKGK